MALLTTQELEKRLKAARKELRAAKRNMLLKTFLFAIFFYSKNNYTSTNLRYQVKKMDLQVYRIQKALKARRKAMQTYQDYKKGIQVKDRAILAYLQYCYFRDKLTNRR